jgi:hypothetical protein
MLELSVYRSLWLWARGRRLGVEPGVAAFSYAGINSVAVWAFIGVAAVELPLFHFLIPWDWARVTLVILGVWTLVWFVGYAGSLRVYPHLVSAKGLRIRQGARVDVFIPWTDVESIRRNTRNYTSGAKVQVEHADSGDVLAVTTSNQTNVDVVLSKPIMVPIRQATGAHIREVRFIVDDPGALCSEALMRLRDVTR